MSEHVLKTRPDFLDAVKKGIKTFEVRYNDRDYQRGDLLELRGYENDRYTGDKVFVRVVYILDFPIGLQPNYVVLGIKL